MKNLNNMNCIHDNKVNNIDKYNLLHDIINPYKHKKSLSTHYYHILNRYISTYRGK